MRSRDPGPNMDRAHPFWPFLRLKTLENVLKTLQDAPICAEDAPKTLQDASKSAQKPPKEPQDTIFVDFGSQH